MCDFVMLLLASLPLEAGTECLAARSLKLTAKPKPGGGLTVRIPDGVLLPPLWRLLKPGGRLVGMLSLHSAASSGEFATVLLNLLLSRSLRPIFVLKDVSHSRFGTGDSELGCNLNPGGGAFTAFLSFA